jgi:intracellular sulfur oxidation DsrE/DsrF family protein
MKAFALLASVGLVAALMAADPTGEPEYQHPLIQGHGGFVAVPGAAEPPAKGAKAVLDITSDETAGGVVKGLDRAALICNQYAHAGVGPDKGMKMAIILHGPATKAALTHDAYVKHSSSYAAHLATKGNPNLKLLERLNDAGVEIYVCAQALAHRGYSTEEVAPVVTVAVSAATVNINKQAAGYAYLPFQ